MPLLHNMLQIAFKYIKRSLLYHQHDMQRSRYMRVMSLMSYTSTSVQESDINKWRENVYPLCFYSFYVYTTFSRYDKTEQWLQKLRIVLQGQEVKCILMKFEKIPVDGTNFDAQHTVHICMYTYCALINTPNNNQCKVFYFLET